VVLPVFDGEAYLAEAVESILKQSLGNIALIAIDDGSRDHSLAILKAHAVADPRLRVVARENRGLVATLNEAITLADSEFVAIMNADDVSLPTRLEKQLGFLQTHPQVAVVGCQVRLLTSGSAPSIVARLPVEPAAVRAFLPLASPVAQPAVMFRRQAVIDCGLYREQMMPAEDYDLWLRISEHHDIANLPEVLLQYRLHAGQVSANRFEAVAAATLAAQGASRSRLRGEPDPLDGVAVLSPAVLQRMGIDQDQIARQTLQNVLGRAEMHLAASRRPADARSLMDSMSDHWAATMHPRLWRACTHWLKARCAACEGRFLTAAGLGVAAIAEDDCLRRRAISRLWPGATPRCG
jgi:glycosyltransferase involved in cell wall biosynthesis